MGSALRPMATASRADALRSRLDGVPLVVTHPVNVGYLTGFRGSAGSVLVGDDEMVLVTDGRYEEQAHGDLAAAGVTAGVRVGASSTDQRGLVSDWLRRRGATRVGLESEHVSWGEQRRWCDALGGVEVVPLDGRVEALRAVKDPGELDRIEAACRIADEAFASVVGPALAEVRASRAGCDAPAGPCEADLAVALDAAVRAGGADDVSFETIVAAGANGSRPHHRPGAHRLRRGELVTIDFGALVEGYHSDMTRTVAVGGVEALDPTRRRMLEVVREAQAAGVAAVRAGIDASEVDAACREVIARAGWGDAFVHGTGHGVGLDIHEAPAVSSRPGATLAARHVVTVEPGVYLPGVGGVRIEDTVEVTAGACRPLTRAPKD